MNQYTAKLWRRDFSGTIALAGGVEVEVRRYAWDRQGGPSWALLAVSGPRDGVAEALEWLRCGVELYSPLDERVWWGYVNTVRVGLGGVTARASLDELHNRVAARYQKTVRSGEATLYEEALTAWADDVDSQAEFGVKEHQVQMTTHDRKRAELARDVELAAHGRPGVSASTGVSSSGSTWALVWCRGWWDTLGWQYYAQPAGLVEHTLYNGKVKVGLGVVASSLGMVRHTNELCDVDCELSEFAKGDRIAALNMGASSGVLTVYRGATATGWSFTSDAISFSGPGIGYWRVSTPDDALGGLDYRDWVHISGSAQNDGYVRVERVGSSLHFFDCWQSLFNGSNGPTVTLTRGHALGILESLQDSSPGSSATVRCLGHQTAQSFVIAGSSPWAAWRVALRVARVGDPVDNLQVRICADNGIAPGTTLATGTWGGFRCGLVADWVEIELAAPYLLQPGTRYWLVVERDGSLSPTAYYVLDTDDNAGYSGGGCKVYGYDSWIARVPASDLAFRVVGEQEVTAQVAALVAACGQFLTGCELPEAWRTFFVDDVNGDDDDHGEAIDHAWRTLGKVNSYPYFLPGDTVRFKCGGTWSQAAPLVVPADDMTIGAYGSGAKPILTDTSAGYGRCVQVAKSRVTIDGLDLRDTLGAGVEITSVGAHNVVRNCEMSNVGVGVDCYGPGNRVTANNIHDLRMVVNTVSPDYDDYGAVGVVLYAAGCEVDHNTFANCRAASHDYEYDGGAVEIFGSAHRAHIHHNFARGCEGFLEIGGDDTYGRTVDDVLVEHNVVETPNRVLHLNLGDYYRVTISRLEVHHNTFVGLPYETAINFVGVAPAGGELHLANNIFYGFTKLSRVLPETPSCAYDHDHNCFYPLMAGWTITPGAGDIFVDPLLARPAILDCRLKSTSPCIDAGVNLGYVTDYAEGDRTVGAGVDIGAYEFDPVSLSSWWLAGGATGVIGAYQPIGAADFAASKVNLAGAGHGLTDGTTPPAWDADTGWYAPGYPDRGYLVTDINPESGYSMIVSYVTLGLGEIRNICGVRSTVEGPPDGWTTKNSFHLQAQNIGDTSGAVYASGGRLEVTPKHDAGVLCVAGQHGYRDGALESGTIPAWGSGETSIAYPIAIGDCAVDDHTGDGDGGYGLRGYIRAIAIYSRTLTAAEVAAVTAAIAIV